MIGTSAMDVNEIDSSTEAMMVEAFLETAYETVERSGSKLQAAREGIVAASMVLSAFTGIEDAEARDIANKWARTNKEIVFS